MSPLALNPLILNPLALNPGAEYQPIGDDPTLKLLTLNTLTLI